MSVTSKTAAKKRSQRKVNLTLIGILVAIMAVPLLLKPAIGLVAFPYISSEGDRIGQVVKLSHRGIFWKTWEGSLGVTQSGAYVEKWDFSVDPSNSRADELVNDLRAAELSGSIVKITYKQHLGTRSWHGKTSYTIESVEPLGISGYRNTLPR